MNQLVSPLALAATFFLAPAALAASADTRPAAEVDMERYLGRWHETARMENFFERGLHAVTALYERLADGRIRVTNAGTSKDGNRQEAIGVAQPVEDASEDGALEVSFVPPYEHFFSDYRILYVTPDYEGALVSDADGNMLWLLERGAESNPEVRAMLLEEARQRGFDTTELIFDEASAGNDSEAEVHPE